MIQVEEFLRKCLARYDTLVVRESDGTYSEIKLPNKCPKHYLNRNINYFFLDKGPCTQCRVKLNTAKNK